MLIALILVPLASLLWGITNYIDKYLISKITKKGDFRGLVVFSSLVAGTILFPISLIISNFKVEINIISFITILLSASSYLIGTVFYFKSLKNNDTSLVIPMFQLIPVFGYFFGLIFLKEVLTFNQIIGGVIVILSAVAITYEVSDNKFNKTKINALLFVTLSSLFFAIYFLLFRLTTIDNNFYVMTFWYQICLIINGIAIILLLKTYRKSFIYLVKNNGKKVFGFNVLNESMNIIANMLVNFSITIVPMALVLTLNGLQPFFVFLIGMLGTLLIPKIFNEDISKKVIIQKVLCIIISIIGLAMLYY